jgi:hypothetical protein
MAFTHRSLHAVRCVEPLRAVNYLCLSLLAAVVPGLVRLPASNALDQNSSSRVASTLLSASLMTGNAAYQLLPNLTITTTGCGAQWALLQCKGRVGALCSSK